MKKLLLILSGLIILVTLQLNWPVFLSLFNTRPDLLLIFSLSLVFYFDFKFALAAAILAGLLKDAFLPAAMAINTPLFILWSCLAFRLSTQISTEDNYVRLFIILIIAVLNNTALGIRSLSSGNFIPAGIFLRNLLVSSFYTGALSPLVFRFAKRIAS